MKLFSLFSIFIFSICITMNAQSTIAGEYYLRGVMETASGFKLNADSLLGDKIYEYVK